MKASFCLTGLCCVLLLGGGTRPISAETGTPLSAIDWLSNSINEPIEDTPPKVDVPLATMPSDITVLPLDAPSPDQVGLQPASALNLDASLWGRSSAADLARALLDLPDGADAPPSVKRFLNQLLTLEFDPPIDAAIDDSFFLARVDRLLSVGQLDPAEALLSAAGLDEPERFRRAFDIALLNGTETEACRTIEESPDLSPTYPARIFCLARLGEWDVAALTLGNAEALGILTPDEDALLLHFLDPELFEGHPLPAPPRQATPLLFRLYEAVGERIATEQLPVAFALADLGTTVGWKSRLRAAERLTAADAMNFDDMLAVYNERKPSASGGIWERVAAIQALVAAIETGQSDRVNAALSTAWIASGQGGFDTALAHWATPRLEGFDLKGPSRHLAFEMALRAGRIDIAEALAGDNNNDRFLLALATGQGGAAPGASLLNQSVLQGLVALSPGQTFEALIKDNRRGEALFRALQHLKKGAGGNPQATQRALALLRALGLDALARQIAVELVLLDGAA